MNPIRLAIIRQKYRPDGGAERFVSRALGALEDQNIELNVITRQWQGEQDPNWHIHLCNPPSFSRISREKGFAEAVQSFWNQQKFDLIQSHERIAGCDIYRAGDGVHRRWLIQRSRILPWWKRVLLMRNRFHCYVMHAEKQLYNNPKLQAVICNAEMIKQEIIEEFAVPAEKIHVIYNAIDAEKFTQASEDEKQQIRQSLQLPETAHYFIFVGSGFERKGLSTAIQAIADSESHLLVVGRDKTAKTYQRLARKLKCADRIHFLGMQADTLRFYQAADALLLPTLYDPFPNVVLEALACGLPVITSKQCGGAEFIRHGENGYITDALDIEGLQKAIRELEQARPYPEKKQAARATILPHNPARLSEQLMQLYKGILAQQLKNI